MTVGYKSAKSRLWTTQKCSKTLKTFRKHICKCGPFMLISCCLEQLSSSFDIQQYLGPHQSSHTYEVQCQYMQNAYTNNLYVIAQMHFQHFPIQSIYYLLYVTFNLWWKHGSLFWCADTYAVLAISAFDIKWKVICHRGLLQMAWKINACKWKTWKTEQF